MEGFVESESTCIQSCIIKNFNSYSAFRLSSETGETDNDMIDSSIFVCEEGREGISCIESDGTLNFALTGTVTRGPNEALQMPLKIIKMKTLMLLLLENWWWI